MNYDVGRYDPCPCGSGAKYKFCCAAKAQDVRHGKFPIGTVAYYGPDDQTTTKIAAGVIHRERAEPILERWVGVGIDRDARTTELIKRFFATHGVKTVVASGGIIGCPHEEGEDFPRGGDCPFCPFWAGKQGSGRRDDGDELGVGLRGSSIAGFDGEGVEGDFDDEIGEDEFDDDDLAELADEDLGEDAADYRDFDAAFARVKAVLGDAELTFDQAIDVLVAHLQANLNLPCEVTGAEDFGWEEPFVIGGWDPKSYRRLKKSQPSYTDRYLLLGLAREKHSDWMMFDEDVGAHVRRLADGKEFILGLAELRVVAKDSPNFQLLDDYSVWFVNNR